MKELNVKGQTLVHKRSNGIRKASDRRRNVRSRGGETKRQGVPSGQKEGGKGLALTEEFKGCKAGSKKILVLISSRGNTKKSRESTWGGEKTSW